MKSPRKTLRARRVIAWAIRGGKCTHGGRRIVTGLIGTVFAPRSGDKTPALFKTRSGARSALKSVKAPIGRDVRGEPIVNLPNARVERVEVIIRPLRRRK